MKKIPTILPKDPSDLGRVIPGPLMNGIDHFQIKIDGTACMIKDGKPYARYDIKKFKMKRGRKITFSDEELQNKIPEGAIECQAPDEKSGHWPFWVPVIPGNPGFKYILEGFNALEDKKEGTYECVGPKINANPHNEDSHVWIPHFHENLRAHIDPARLTNGEVAFEFFHKIFEDFPFEGFVAYNKEGNPIGKIRRSDFGYKNSGFNKASNLIQGA